MNVSTVKTKSNVSLSDKLMGEWTVWSTAINTAKWNGWTAKETWS